MKTKHSLLGGLTYAEFLREYWQKKPLLIRQAMPGFNGLLTPQQLFELSALDSAQARLVKHSRGTWQLSHGPFEVEKIARQRGHWSILLQGVNHFLPQATELLKYFNFIPHARLDDLMVSYAPAGGGVGPHFDAYDVFLLQGMGHRRWQISTQQDRTLVEGAPLRILKQFEVEQEWVLEPGDMLYLPPHCAHNGIAQDDCMTYSIGFRTPTYQELAEQFLVYLQDRVEVEGTYADPDLKYQAHPSEIGLDMLRKVARAIASIRWDEEDVANFLGSYLSEPKPHIFFEAPYKPLSASRFSQALQTQPIALALQSQMLCHGDSVFINGESYSVGKESYAELREFADKRQLEAGRELSPQTITQLYEFYLAGYAEFIRNRKKS